MVGGIDMIYVVKNKPYETEDLSKYVDLYVGDMFNEDGRDNINHLNPYINELTGLYDIWKNKSDKVVGMCHYRRFFVYKDHTLKFTDTTRLLKNAEIITLNNNGPLKLDEFLEQAITKPIYDKYIPIMPEDFQKWLKEANSFNPCNMFVCRKELIDKYCEWMFPMIIPMAEQFVKEDINGDFHHDRAIGFIGELLFGYWCKYLDRCNFEFKFV